MTKLLLGLNLTLFSLSLNAQAFCTGDNSRGLAGPFCIRISDRSLHIAHQELIGLQSKIEFLSSKFPNLISRVTEKGYRTLTIGPVQKGETGGAVLAALQPKRKTIILYEDFFSVLRKNPALESLPYSVADIALLHELIHAFDDDNQIIQSNLKAIGWDINQNTLKDQFTLPELPGFANIWIKSHEVEKIKKDLSPLLNTLGPWEVYRQARFQVMKSGYPTIYSILGGPLESFAELGAYIGLDPTAATYIPNETIKWFRQNLLN
jgi:hypothetical protein